MQNLRLSMAFNNLWANHRLGKALVALPPGLFEAPRPSFFGSIRATVQHILEVDRFYVDALEGGSLGAEAWSLPLPGSAEGLREEQQRWDLRLVALCRQPPEAVWMDRGHRGRLQDRADRILLHLFQHQVHHRGQVHQLLSAAGAQPPQLDEFFCTNEAHLRATDLQELGLAESEVWPG